MGGILTGGGDTPGIWNSFDMWVVTHSGQREKACEWLDTVNMNLTKDAGCGQGVVSCSRGAPGSLDPMVTSDSTTCSPPPALCASPVLLMSSSLQALDSVFERSTLRGRKCSVGAGSAAIRKKNQQEPSFVRQNPN